MRGRYHRRVSVVLCWGSIVFTCATSLCSWRQSNKDNTTHLNICYKVTRFYKIPLMNFVMHFATYFQLRLKSCYILPKKISVAVHSVICCSWHLNMGKLGHCAYIQHAIKDNNIAFVLELYLYNVKGSFYFYSKQLSVACTKHSISPTYIV